MAFPLTPANNQIALVNGIEYYYNTNKGAWYRYGDVTANVITSNTFQVLSSIIFTDGTSQNSAVNPIDSYARTTANAAFTQANTNANNISITNGVDATQNTRLNSIETINIDQNTAISIIQGTDATQNVRLNSIETVNVDQNTSISIIQGVDSTQNTNITIATNAATGAFEQANATAGGLTTANGRMSIIEGVDATQNTNITIADTKAQAAFDKANSANVLAQAAYDQANTGGGGTLDQFARDTANSASSNTIIIQGVDVTQNTRMTIIEGVNTTQNTNITVADTKAQAAFDSANTKLSLSGGTIAGNVTANSVIANTSIYVPTIYSTGATSKLELSDIGLVAITVAGQTYQFGGSGIESNQGVFGGSFGGNRLSLNNETNLISNRYDTVKIQTGTTGTVVNEWSFSNNRLIFPDNTYQNTAFTDAQVTNITIADTKAQAAFDKANAANSLAQAAYDQANTGGGGTLDQFARDTANGANGLAAGAYAAANTKYDSTGGTISGSVTLTGTITGNVSIATNSSQANSIGYLGVPQSNLNPMSASYTLTISDSGEHLYMVPSSSALTVNIPPNDSVPFPIGTAIVTVLDAAFKSNVVPQTGVTLRLAGNTAGSNVARTLSEYSMASLIKVDTNLWYISGAGVT